LSTPNGGRWYATEYRAQWYDTLKELGFGEHRPHDTRHTFRSRLDSAGGNKVAIDLLMGHASKSVGERVYTHKTLDELRQTISLLG
jgi:integrase